MSPTPSLPQKQHTTNPDRGHVKECSCTGPGDQLNHIESLEKPRGGTDKKQNTTLLCKPKRCKLETDKTPIMRTSQTRNSKKHNQTNLKQISGNSTSTKVPGFGTTIIQ